MKEIILNEQQVTLLNYLLALVEEDNGDGYSKTSKAIALQIINKLEEK